MKRKILISFWLLFVSFKTLAFDIVKPDTEHDLVKDADIRNDSLSVGVYAGIISYENFNTSYLAALYVSYPFNEKVFVEAEFGASSINDTEYRNIGLPLFDKEESGVSFYSVLVGYNLLPGEVYWSKDKTLISSFYLIGGIGSVSFDDQDTVAVNLGAGFKMELDDNKSVRFEARDRIFDTDTLGSDKLSNNVEFHLGIDWNFR